MFGYDVAVQKARTAAFFSRPDARAAIVGLESRVTLIDLQALGAVDPSVTSPFAQHTNRAATIGVMLDGSVAVSDRAGGFPSPRTAE
jgi:hypothetical protein